MRWRFLPVCGGILLQACGVDRDPRAEDAAAPYLAAAAFVVVAVPVYCIVRNVTTPDGHGTDPGLGLSLDAVDEVRRRLDRVEPGMDESGFLETLKLPAAEAMAHSRTTMAPDVRVVEYVLCPDHFITATFSPSGALSGCHLSGFGWNQGR